MYPINLQELFDSTCQTEYTEHYNCIYMIRNLLNDYKYIGQAVDFYSRFMIDNFLGHKYEYLKYVEYNLKKRHLYNALRKYCPSNFEVSIVEENLRDSDEMDNRESYWIAFYNTFKGPGYNMNAGGRDNSQLRQALVNQYPDTNGMPPQAWDASMKVRSEKYGMNGMTPQCVEAGRKALEEKYPETNGMPPQCIEAGLKAMQLLYPKYNGIPEKTFETLKKKYPLTNGVPYEAHEAAAKKYPELNGISPQCMEAANKAMKEKYPDTNGAPPQWIEAGVLANREARLKMWPGTNGVPPQATKAAQETSRANKVWRAYQAVVEMCINLRADGYTKWTRKLYGEYRIKGAPHQYEYYMQPFYRNCIEFGLDVSKFVDTFPDEWIPEEYR